MGMFDDLIPGGGKAPQAAPPISPEQKKSIRIDALDKILAARRALEGSGSFMGTGFMAPTMSGVGGTNAASVRAAADTLKSSGALSKIMKMAAENGGKNPLTPMSNSDVDLIANSTANLDIAQPDEDFQRNTRLYEDAYKRAFEGASDNHQNLEEGLRWRQAVQSGKPYAAPRWNPGGRNPPAAQKNNIIEYDAKGNRIR